MKKLSTSVQGCSTESSLIHFILGCSNRCILNGGDFVLDHGAHRVYLEWLGGLFLLGSFNLHNLVVLNWGLGLRVLGSIGNNGGVSFDSGRVHWDFCFFLLLLFDLFLGFLTIFLVLIVLLVVALLLVCFLVFFLRLLLLWFLFFLGFCGWFLLSCINRLSVLLHILSQGFHKVISEASTKLNSLGLLHVGGAQEGSEDKCR